MRDKRTPRDVCREAIAGDDLDPGGGLLNISLGGEVWPGPSYPDPV